MKNRLLSALLTVLLCLALLPAGALAAGSYGPDTDGWGYYCAASVVELGPIDYDGSALVGEDRFQMELTNTGTRPLTVLGGGEGAFVLAGETTLGPGETATLFFDCRIPAGTPYGPCTQWMKLFFEDAPQPCYHQFKVTYELVKAAAPAPGLTPAEPEEDPRAPADPEPSEAPDFDGSSWAARPVQRAITEGLLPAGLRGSYTEPITRREFCVLAGALYTKVRGGPPSAGESVAFTDTDDPDVLAMARLGVVTGVGGGAFDPGGKLTREQAAAILTRLAVVLDHPLPQGDPTFTDSGEISSWALEAVGSVQAGGLMEGTGEDRFSPQTTYTREQSVVTLLRLYDRVK